MNKRTVAGLFLVGIGLFWPSIESLILKNNNVTRVDYNKMLNLKQPNEKVYNELKDIKDIVSGPSEEIDRELIAIFNNEMAKRLSKYENINTLAFENYYADAGKNFYQGRISNKYNELGNKMYQVILSTLGDNEVIITKEEMENLSEKMRAMSWILLN